MWPAYSESLGPEATNFVQVNVDFGDVPEQLSYDLLILAAPDSSARLFVAPDGAGAFDYLYSPGHARPAKSFDRVVRSIDCPQQEGALLLQERHTSHKLDI